MEFSVKIVKAAVTHSRIFKKIESGSKVVYQYFPQNDTLQNELIALAKKYRKTSSIAIKQELLDKESEILYQEIKNPELTLVRNHKAILGSKKKFNPRKFFDWLQALNISAIRRLEFMSQPFTPKLTKRKVSTLTRAFEGLSDKTQVGKNAKSEILDCIDLSTKEKIFKDRTFFGKILKRLSNSTENPALKKSIEQLFLLREVSHSKSMRILEQNPFQKNELQKFLVGLSKEYSYSRGAKSARKFATKLVKELLNRKDTPPAIRRIATWAAGTYKSNDAFKQIEKIALNKREKDIRLREFALHSVSLYARKKPNEVKAILSTVEQDGSIFSPLATILKDKISGVYHSRKNIEYERLGIGKEEAKTLAKQIKALFKHKDFKSNTRIDNEIDRNMLFFKELLPWFKEHNSKAIITEDSVTKFFRKDIIKRDIEDFPKLNCGSYWDTIDGLNDDAKPMGKIIIASKNCFDTNCGYKALTHEFAHSIEASFNKEDTQKLIDLYKNAKRHHRFMDSYSSCDQREYFAQGCEAMASLYKTHDSLISVDDCYANTRYKLMAKDKPLYDFILQMMEKYSKLPS